MKFLKSVRYQTLYLCWAGLFVLTGVLGLVFPDSSGLGRAALLGLSVAFFLPPWMILLKARQEENLHHRRLIRLLSAAALLAATVLLCVSILSANGSDGLNTALHAVVSIVTAPMICSNYYVVPLFLWATLLVGSFTRKK